MAVGMMKAPGKKSLKSVSSSKSAGAGNSPLAREFRAAIEAGDIGTYLRLARERSGLSQGDVADKLGMSHFQSVSQWERNASGSVPMPALRKLVEIYGLSLAEVYDVMLKFQTMRLEAKLEQKFFGSRKGGRTA
jgi:DNA-binding transcriptional regulator YiaG